MKVEHEIHPWERPIELYRPRGFGIWVRSGCLGSIVGDPRPRYFKEITLLFWRWHRKRSEMWVETEETL